MLLFMCNFHVVGQEIKQEFLQGLVESQLDCWEELAVVVSRAKGFSVGAETLH